MTYEELAEHIKVFPGRLALAEHGPDVDSVEEVMPAAMAEVAVAANLARATQESLKMRVEIARGRGANVDHDRERHRDDTMASAATVLRETAFWRPLVAADDGPMMTYEELVEEIGVLPFSLAMQEYGADPDHVEDDVAEALAELAVAANLAQAAQASLKVRVDFARSRGATWRMIGRAVGLTPWRTWRRKWETRPLDARH